MIWLFALVACLEPRQTEATCTSCHGDADSWAPPAALGGETTRTFIGVGAHREHLDAATPVACTECHVVPAAVGDAGHIDDAWPAEVTWGPLAITGDLTPSWDRTAETCVVYCHGSTLSGDPGTSPTWTSQNALTCQSCHGSPPPDPHPQDSACASCHPSPSPETHIDGVVQASGEACAGCHGDGDTLAPPPDTSGNTDTSVVTVGAHRAHVDGGAVSNPVPCATCHVVPAATGDAGHIDAAPAEVTFSGLATDDGASPTWDRTTCADSYCHGGTLRGGSNTDPVWTTVDGSQAACGSCHGLPPPSPHPQSSSCASCHDSAGPGLTIAHPDRHVDGVLDL